MPDGLRREQTRGLERRVTATDLDPAIFGTPGSIVPDAAAAAGTAPTVSHSDHTHGFTSAAPAGLTKTATASEGAASTHARSDHVHSTDALPWGVLAYQNLTANGTAQGNANTDFTLTVSPDVTRLYKLCISGLAATGGLTTADLVPVWEYNATIAGTTIARLVKRPFITTGVGAATTAGNIQLDMCGHALWLPASAASQTIIIAQNQITATNATLQPQGSAIVPRAFWIEDIGPR